MRSSVARRHAGHPQFVLAGQAAVALRSQRHIAAASRARGPSAAGRQVPRAAIVDHAGVPKGVSPMQSAMTVCDLESCEGILGIRSHTGRGALPDMMQRERLPAADRVRSRRLACEARERPAARVGAVG